MSTSALARSRYAADSVTTASPARLLVMLYDRLVRDLVTAERALVDPSPAEQGGASGDQARGALLHAQEIVLELRASLDMQAWDGAAGLADLYTFVHGELVSANLERNISRVTPCREIVEELRDAWKQAALASLAT